MQVSVATSVKFQNQVSGMWQNHLFQLRSCFYSISYQHCSSMRSGGKVVVIGDAYIFEKDIELEIFFIFDLVSEFGLDFYAILFCHEIKLFKI